MSENPSGLDGNQRARRAAFDRRNPLKAAVVALRGVRTEGDMAPEIPLDRQRPAKYVFSRHVEDAMARLGTGGKRQPESARRAS